METTTEVREAVLNSVCIHCGSFEITGDSVAVESGSTWQTITCDACGESWHEVYTFSHVEETD